MVQVLREREPGPFVRPRKGPAAVCSRCHQPAPGYDQLPERRFEFIPLWGFFVFLLYAMRYVACPRCGAVVVEEVPWGDGKRTLTKAYMLFLARWARRLSWKETPRRFALPGKRFLMPSNTLSPGACNTAHWAGGPRPGLKEVPLAAAQTQ
jgi:hypothetical protein